MNLASSAVPLQHSIPQTVEDPVGVPRILFTCRILALLERLKSVNLKVDQEQGVCVYVCFRCDVYVCFGWDA